ncbi:MAG: DUF4245 family protein [Solirubrobacteraceae bacterium]
MSEVPHRSTGDEVGLGGLLVLLHDADAPFRSVEATYRVWRHEERLRKAFLADAEQLKRRGASITTFSTGSGDPEPAETEATMRICRQGNRFRVEHHGGQRDGDYAVADGPLWWMWDERMGAMSNHDDPSVGSGVGQELDVMFNPTPLLSSLRFRVTGSDQVAGRATITADATPPHDPRRRSLELHELGAGAHHYELEVDQERGVLLAVTAIRDDRPFHKITALAIGFDDRIPDETFRFTPPEGEEIQTTRHSHRLQHITLTEAQQRAPFTVLMPDRVPEDWQVHCTLLDASQRPPSPTQVSLGYRSDDGHQSISISQMAAADRASHHYENMVNEGEWQEAVHDGTSVKVRPAGWGQAQAHLNRDGTFVFLVSDNLTADQLGTIAAGLRPAPSVGSL